MNDIHTHNDLGCHIFCMFGPMLGIPKLYFYVGHVTTSTALSMWYKFASVTGTAWDACDICI